MVNLSLGHASFANRISITKTTACNRDTKMAEIEFNNVEIAASNRCNWRSVVTMAWEKIDDGYKWLRGHRKQRSANATFSSQPIVPVVVWDVATCLPLTYKCM